MIDTNQRDSRSRRNRTASVDLCASVATAYAPDVAVGPCMVGDIYSSGQRSDIEATVFVTCLALGRGDTLVTVARYNGHFLEVCQTVGPVDGQLERALSGAESVVAATPDELAALQCALATTGRAKLALEIIDVEHQWVARSRGHFAARELSQLGLTRDVLVDEADLELLMRRARGDADLQAWRSVLELGRTDILSCVALYLGSLPLPTIH